MASTDDNELDIDECSESETPTHTDSDIQLVNQLDNILQEELHEQQHSPKKKMTFTETILGLFSKVVARGDRIVMLAPQLIQTKQTTWLSVTCWFVAIWMGGGSTIASNVGLSSINALLQVLPFNMAPHGDYHSGKMLPPQTVDM